MRRTQKAAPLISGVKFEGQIPMTKAQIPDVSRLKRPVELFDDYDDGFEGFPSHIVTLYENWSELINFVELQECVHNGKDINSINFDIINKSGIVLLVASWEAYIEDLAKNAFGYLIQNADSPNIFTNKVLLLSVKEIHKRNITKLWALAGEGWKDILLSYKDKVLSQYVGRFNSPRHSQVDKLFADLLGFNNFSKRWKWRGMSNKRALDKLENLINLRGEIAHRARSSKRY